MSLDHLCEEGSAEFEEIEVPISIIFFLLVLLTISYMIHFNGHFYIFGLIVKTFLWIYGIWTTVQDAIFYWYFILHFNYNIKHKERPLDSTQGRDQPIDLETDHQILPESPAPTTEIIRGIRQQIYFNGTAILMRFPLLLLLLVTSPIFHRTLSIYLCMLIFLTYMNHQRYNKINN